MKNFFWLLLTIFLVPCFADESQFEYSEGVYADIHTNKGLIIAKLEYEKAPLTVTNFVGLAEGKFETSVRKGIPYFDGLTFHRVVKDFVIQGGCPLGNGRGEPGYRFANEIHKDLKHSGPGILSMANAGADTNGSQFFITHSEQSRLDGKYSVFGYVVLGQNVVDEIQIGDRMEKVVIKRIGEKAQKFTATWKEFEKLRKEAKDKKMAEMRQKLKDQYDQVDEQFPVTGNDKYSARITTESGLMYILIQEGSGDIPVTGNNVTAHYTGKFLNGEVFDSSLTRNSPFKFRVGAGQVIAGWDEAFAAMKKGEKRILIIPPHLGYGERGVGPIPPNSILIFEVELLNISH